MVSRVPVLLSNIVDERRSRPANPFYRDVPPTKPRVRYLIAMTPRSGSTLLARQLSACGIGHPQEFLNESFLLRFEELFPDPTLADFEAFVLGHYTSSDGVFGLKADWTRLNAARAADYLPELHSSFDLYIYLTRGDLLSQAISLSVAQQSGVWEEVQARYADPNVYARLAYDEQQITDNIAALMEHEYQWTKFLQCVKRPVLRLTFEQLAMNPDAVVASIAGELELTVPYAPPSGGRAAIEPVPSRVNSAWRLRYLAQHRDHVALWARARGLRPGA
jgi:LPS sulfotransferase NodH